MGGEVKEHRLWDEPAYPTSIICLDCRREWKRPRPRSLKMAAIYTKELANRLKGEACVVDPDPFKHYRGRSDKAT